MNSSPSPAPKYRPIHWDDVHALSISLADYLRDKGINHIVAVSRGGLVPATIISHLLGVRDVRSLYVRQYDEDHQKGSMFMGIGWDIANLLYKPTTVIVDDIIDSGKTFFELHKRYPNPIKVALISKLNDGDINAYWPEFSPPDVWVQFPWERVRP